MKRKMIAILICIVMMLSLAACDAGEETTLTGMIVSVDGTKISLMEMDMSNMSRGNAADGERPQMPEGMEGFGNFNPESFGNFKPESFGNFDPENFGGAMPEGGNFPQWGSGSMPENMTPPEGMTIPENGQMPNFFGGSDGSMSGFGNFAADAETKEIDIADAHISVEIEGGKASGSMEDLKAGVFVTITMNGKGKVTNVLVSSQSFFGGRFGK